MNSTRYFAMDALTEQAKGVPIDFFASQYPGRLRGAQRAELDENRRSSDRTAEDLRELTDTVDRLTLACKALWELLCEHSSLQEEDLLTKIRDIDLADGKLDGKASPSPLTCSQCDRANSQRRTRCLYCGEELPPSSIL